MSKITSTIILSKSDENIQRCYHHLIRIQIFKSKSDDSRWSIRIMILRFFSVFCNYQFFVSYIIDHIRFLETNSNPKFWAGILYLVISLPKISFIILKKSFWLIDRYTMNDMTYEDIIFSKDVYSMIVYSFFIH